MSKPIGRLNVHMIEGKNMPAMDWNGSSDCFATMTLGKISQKTKVVMKSLQPVWNERFEFEIYNMKDDLIIFIADWDRFSKNDKIGQVSYPLSKLNSGKNEIWLDLPIVNGVTPSIHFILQFQPKITVTVIEGKNLPKMDWNGKSDPYVELVYMNNTKRTSIIKKNLNPIWNETFDFEVWSMTEVLYVNVWDWDLIGKNDPMGSAVVTLTSLKNGPNDLWLSLPKQGEIHLSITGNHLPVSTQGSYQPQQYNTNTGFQQNYQQQTNFQSQQQQQFQTQQAFQYQPQQIQQNYSSQQQYSPYQQQQQQVYSPMYSQQQFDPNFNPQQQQQQFNPNLNYENQQPIQTQFNPQFTQFNSQQQYSTNQQVYQGNQYNTMQNMYYQQ